jgi:hypothetical protein
MSISAASEFDDEDEGSRVIDRSGDIDQRPPEERPGPAVGSNVVSFQGPRPASLSPIPAPAQLFEPAPSSRKLLSPSASLADLAQRVQKDLDKQYAKAKSQLEALTQKIESQEKRCLPPKLDDDLQQIRFQRQKVLIANGPTLADHLSEERRRLADLERFKTENRITREAHYPSSPTLSFGVLFVLVLVEACINGVLFAESSDQGLLGGWLEAVVLSVTNVGAAFLIGRIVFPQMHRRGVFLPAFATGVSAVGVTLILGVNLFGAHYRDFKAETAALETTVQAPAAPKPGTTILTGGAKPIANTIAGQKAKPSTLANATPLQAEVGTKQKQTERQAIVKALERPFDLESFTSFFLLVLGSCGAIIAAWDGYKFDDPFPGYGKRHRRYMESRARSAEALRRILAQSNSIMTGSFHAISRKIENYAHEMAALLTFHHTYAGDHKSLKDKLEEAARDAEAEIACHDRLLNKLPDRDIRELYAVSLKELPALGEKHIKFYESQEKRLKSLQKNAQKEQNDVLGVFDAASADFQRLLADATQASLQAAFADPSSKAIRSNT